MSVSSKIEWTDSTWGCTRKSPGCGGPGKEGGCYAEKIAAKLALVESALTIPLHWKKPRRIFVNSMSDLFHENLPDEAIDRIFAIMALCPQHTFQVLTKRAERMRAYINSHRDYLSVLVQHGPAWRVDDEAFDDARDRLDRIPLPNVWLGVSAERQQEADERIPHLMATPAAVRFISAEPLLGPLTITYLEWARLDWVIVGGESGKNARPMHPDWARDIRDQCKAAGVAFFFKQWGGWEQWDQHPILHWRSIAGGALTATFPNGVQMIRVGKARAGRLLDGHEHNAMPQVSP